jgi:hypothetical protein
MSAKPSGVASAGEPEESSSMPETPKEAMDRRTEYIGDHALEGEFDDIVGCMAEERRVTLEEVKAIVETPGSSYNVVWEIKKLLKELSE